MIDVLAFREMIGYEYDDGVWYWVIPGPAKWLTTVPVPLWLLDQYDITARYNKQRDAILYYLEMDSH